MKKMINIKLLFFALAFLYLSTGTALAQQEEGKRLKIELTVKAGNEQVTSAIRSFTVAYNRALNDTGKDSVAEPPKGHYLSIDLEKQHIPLLRVLMPNRKGLDGQITVVDTYGKLPTRKIEFKLAVMETMNDQVTGDYGGAFMTLNCATLIIDGVKLEY